jgi:CheY-like chemotaxis protein
MLKRVLVAEDDPGDAFLLERAFTRCGVPARLHFVRDGREAIDYLGGENAFANRDEFPLPDLILLDLKMPRMGGFDVLEWLRAQPGLKRLLVAVLSSSAQPEDINRSYDLGANSYLVKPKTSEDLSNMVNQLQQYWLQVNQGPDDLSQ